MASVDIAESELQANGKTVVVRDCGGSSSSSVTNDMYILDW